MKGNLIAALGAALLMVGVTSNAMGQSILAASSIFLGTVFLFIGAVKEDLQ